MNNRKQKKLQKRIAKAKALCKRTHTWVEKDLFLPYNFIHEVHVEPVELRSMVQVNENAPIDIVKEIAAGEITDNEDFLNAIQVKKLSKHEYDYGYVREGVAVYACTFSFNPPIRR